MFVGKYFGVEPEGGGVQSSPKNGPYGHKIIPTPLKPTHHLIHRVTRYTMYKLFPPIGPVNWMMTVVKSNFLY